MKMLQVFVDRPGVGIVPILLEVRDFNQCVVTADRVLQSGVAPFVCPCCGDVESCRPGDVLWMECPELGFRRSRRMCQRMRAA